MHRALKDPRLLAVCFGLVIVFGFVLFAKEPAKQVGKCGPYREDKIVVLGSAKLKTERVQTQSDLSKGLGGRPCIEADHAMLFEFSRPGQYYIWMKDMKFPIDVFYISPERKVVAIEKDLRPSTNPEDSSKKKTYPGTVNKDTPALYVLEAKAGLADQYGIGLGSTVSW